EDMQLVVIIPSLRADRGAGAIKTNDGTRDRRSNQRTVFDARAIDRTRVFLGNPSGLLAPNLFKTVDVDQDGLVDLLAQFNTSACRSLSLLPVDPKAPITLYFRTMSGKGYEVRNVLGS